MEIAFRAILVMVGLVMLGCWLGGLFWAYGKLSFPDTLWGMLLWGISIVLSLGIASVIAIATIVIARDW